MINVTRRLLKSRGAAGLAALGLFDVAPHAAAAQLVWTTSEWKLADFQKLVNDPARIKQLYDVVQIGDGKFLNNVKNSFNGLRFGFGIPERKIKIAVALHGPANMLNYDDYVWEKYQIGDWLKVTDSATGKPAVKNLFYGSKISLRQAPAPKNPDHQDSIYQDTSMQALQSRGAQFLSCHSALEDGRGCPLTVTAVMQAGSASAVPNLRGWHHDCKPPWLNRRLRPGAGNTAYATPAGQEVTMMDSNYVFLCGVMWCRFGQQDAGKELLRAADVADADMKELASAMFSKGLRRLREVEKRTEPSSGTILERELWG